MTKLGPWGNDDFEKLSWHDVHIHGFRLEKCNHEDGSADLVLDIDYILEWHCLDIEIQFTICQGFLQFQNVSNLKFELNYEAPSAGMCPFSIARIERKAVVAPTGYRYFHWRFPINWPKGYLEFMAPSFTLALVGEPLVQHQQYLSSEKRI